MNQALGRLKPPDDIHIQKYPLLATNMPEKPVPVTVGVDWHSAFDHPVKGKDGSWWVAKDGNLGSIRGGHCVCLPHDPKADTWAWYKYYDQGQEGACVGFGASRMMSLLNRKRYDARWLYHEAQKRDFWPGGAYPNAYPFYEGTTVRAAMDALREQGHKKPKGEATPGEGILTNRWATNIDQVLLALGNPLYKKLGAIPFLNSWGVYDKHTGEGYPHLVWAPCEAWDKLLQAWGEFTIITDR